MRELNINFKDPITDLIWLLDKKYPKKSAVELVGNRYSLNHEERMILYRGVFDFKSSEKRKKKLIDPDKIRIDKLIIDGYNVLITLESYLSGKIVFRSLDGYVRDISGMYGEYILGNLTKRSTGLLVDFIKRESFTQGIVIYLDYPVSKSGELASYLRNSFKTKYMDVAVDVVKCPDETVVHENQHSSHSAVATSDTVIIDRVERVIDIPDYMLCTVLKKAILDLRDIK